MCLLSEVKRSSMGGGGCDAEAEAFGLSLVLGAMDEFSQLSEVLVLFPRTPNKGEKCEIGELRIQLRVSAPQSFWCFLPFGFLWVWTG